MHPLNLFVAHHAFDARASLLLSSRHTQQLLFTVVESLEGFPIHKACLTLRRAEGEREGGERKRVETSLPHLAAFGLSTPEKRPCCGN